MDGIRLQRESDWPRNQICLPGGRYPLKPAANLQPISLFVPYGVYHAFLSALHTTALQGNKLQGDSTNRVRASEPPWESRGVVLVESGLVEAGLSLPIVQLIEFRWWDVTDRSQKPLIVEPSDRIERCELSKARERCCRVGAIWRPRDALWFGLYIDIAELRYNHAQVGTAITG